MMTAGHASNHPRLRRLFRRPIAGMVALALLSNAAHATLEVNVTRIGFPTIGGSDTAGGGDVVRTSSWAPVIVDLSLLEQQTGFDGTVRLAQVDGDGDQCYDSVEVHLRAETGGTQRVYLYIMPRPVYGRSQYVVEVRDQEGQTVEVVSRGERTHRSIPSEPPRIIPDEALLILDVSTGVLGRLRDLTEPDQMGQFVRPIFVAHVAPPDLPELWIGLETVDYVVWDNAEPELLTDRQLDALLNWVRQGGTLLMAAARSSSAITMTRSLADALPVVLGEVITVDDLPKVRRELLGTPHNARGFSAPVQFVKCALRDGAKVVVNEPTIDAPVIVRGRVGRGYIIFSAVELSDLFRAEGSPSSFFRKVLHLRSALGNEFSEGTSIFGWVAEGVAFTRSSSLYLLLAGLFSATYVVVATFGCWSFLRARGWQRHSWNAFALVALAASVLSVISVNAVHGFGDRLHQISIIDLHADESYGYATAYFGLKSSVDKQLDVWLPSDSLSATEPRATTCTLRPIPAGNETELASFADPTEYQLRPGSAVVDNVRLRATLKRFEGRWNGRLDGHITGKITVKQSEEGTRFDWRITSDSYLINNLGVDLQRCYLLHSVMDHFAVDHPFHNDADRRDHVYVYPLAKIPATGEKILLEPLCYRPAVGQTVANFMSEHTLQKAQDRWANRFLGLGLNFRGATRPDLALSLDREQDALMLASTLGDFVPPQDKLTWMGPKTILFDRIRQLDLRKHLRRDTAILIGFTTDPGPIRLFTRSGNREFRTLEPDPRYSWTMYRISIPLNVIETQRIRAPEEEDDESTTGA